MFKELKSDELIELNGGKLDTWEKEVILQTGVATVLAVASAPAAVPIATAALISYCINNDNKNFSLKNKGWEDYARRYRR
ncbi:hypothetical protein [Alkaliphilus serpentinus]|uniref:Uncharacterized protein n=1 Tax=Alkaliphilus serpentinus TaxID=1482731 RepID=A0A833M827_9FIRM|nr:hypothetical protein [Alkaliphilus serpentinus]KAB3531777.1 hypothetical protein F8153_03400 [Alkaliphilus serpentinus]